MQRDLAAALGALLGRLDRSGFNIRATGAMVDKIEDCARGGELGREGGGGRGAGGEEGAGAGACALGIWMFLHWLAWQGHGLRTPSHLLGHAGSAAEHEWPMAKVPHATSLHTRPSRRRASSGTGRQHLAQPMQPTQAATPKQALNQLLSQAMTHWSATRTALLHCVKQSNPQTLGQPAPQSFRPNPKV